MRARRVRRRAEASRSALPYARGRESRLSSRGDAAERGLSVTFLREGGFVHCDRTQRNTRKTNLTRPSPRRPSGSSAMMAYEYSHAVSRTYQYKKITKPLLERKRRARINRCLDELKDLMVDALATEEENISKLEKADILELTVRHLQMLQASRTGGSPVRKGATTTPSARMIAIRRMSMTQAKTLSDKANESNDSHDVNAAESRWQSGFGHCAAEACRFLATLPGETAESLAKHLAAGLQSNLKTIVTTTPMTATTATTTTITTPRPESLRLSPVLATVDLDRTANSMTPRTVDRATDFIDKTVVRERNTPRRQMSSYYEKEADAHCESTTAVDVTATSFQTIRRFPTNGGWVRVNSNVKMKTATKDRWQSSWDQVDYEDDDDDDDEDEEEEERANLDEEEEIDVERVDEGDPMWRPW